MYGVPMDLSTFDLVTAGVAGVSLLGLLFLSKNWPSLLWAILLGGVAALILWLPENFKEIIVGGCAASMFLILVSELRARRKERQARAELDKLSTAVTEIQNRNILAEVRLAGASRAPLADQLESPSAVQKLAASPKT
jgi:hypothetical protein